MAYTVRSGVCLSDGQVRVMMAGRSALMGSTSSTVLEADSASGRSGSGGKTQPQLEHTAV